MIRKTIILLVVLSQITIKGIGQVQTRYFQNRKSDTLFMYHKGNSSHNTYVLPTFNVDSILIEDKDMEDCGPFRFGKEFDVNITLEDGDWENVGDNRIWSMTFKSAKAYSLNFIFKNFHLPEGAELYIVSQDGNVEYGPVTSKAINCNNLFLTDVIPDSCVTIYLKEPFSKKGESTLTICRVVHGYKYINIDRNGGLIGSSSECNIDVSCYPDFSEEAKAIALILLSSGKEWATGSLVMTTDWSLKPYILTAFHNLDANINGNLEIGEIIDSQNWLFKFNHKSLYCGSSTPATSYLYNGAEFRAAYNSTDFALIEISSSVNATLHNWLGWDKTGVTPTYGACIHYPAGDLMKISIENDSFTTAQWDNSGPYNHWSVDFDNGIRENGSSGAPILNENRKVVGQLHGGPTCSDLCDQTISKFGKFNLSWTGGGTNTTRLSNWLDPVGIGASIMPGNFELKYIGSSVVCGTQTYYILNLPSWMSVSWSLTFNSGNSAQLATNTPATNQCQVTRTASTPFSATLTATITYQGQTIKTLTKALSGNIPIAMSFYTYSTTQGSGGQPHTFGTTNYINVSPNTYYYVTSPSLPGMTLVPFFPVGSSGYVMQRVSETEIMVCLPPSGFMAVAATGSGCDNFTLTFAASSSKSYALDISGDGEQMRASLVPDTEDLNARNAGQEEENVNWTLEVYETTKAELTATQKVEGLSCTLDTSRWKPGLYIVRALIGDETLTEKINLK